MKIGLNRNRSRWGRLG